MNRAQRQLVWSGAVVAALLAVEAAKVLSKPGAGCRNEIHSFVDARGRFVQAKSLVCD